MKNQTSQRGNITLFFITPLVFTLPYWENSPMRYHILNFLFCETEMSIVSQHPHPAAASGTVAQKSFSPISFSLWRRFVLANGRVLCAIIELASFKLALNRASCAVIDLTQFYARLWQSIVCRYRSYSSLCSPIEECCVLSLILIY